jgi:hypothetical protein
VLQRVVVHQLLHMTVLPQQHGLLMQQLEQLLLLVLVHI